MAEPLLPDLAANVALWFPELGGRSLAVSEADITRENMPKLPLAMTALVRTDVDGNWVYRAANADQKLYDDIMLEFWLESVRVKRQDGSETPFWAYYDYETFRDNLLTHIMRYVGPKKQRLEFRTMTVESDQYAVVLSFRFRAHFNWCPNVDEDGDGQPINSSTIAQNLCPPKSVVCNPCFDEPKECDPCPSV